MRDMVQGVKDDSRIFQGSFQGISRKFSKCTKEVLSRMALIVASRAEGGLVFGIVGALGPSLSLPGK